MIDYDFYVNTYMGSLIPEKAFPGVAVRAVQALDRIRKRYKVIPAHQVTTNMALCAMAETLYSTHGGLTSASVGSVSVRYGKVETLQKRLLESARIYLDIYRGAGVCNAP